MNLDFETVQLVNAIRKQVNTTPIEDIHFFKKNKEIIFDSNVLEDWKFIGLNNWDFFDDSINITVLRVYKKEQE